MDYSNLQSQEEQQPFITDYHQIKTDLQEVKNAFIWRYQVIVIVLAVVGFLGILFFAIFYAYRSRYLTIVGTQFTWNGSIQATGDVASDLTSIDQLSARVTALSTLLQNIQLTPGPQGPQGPQGSSGSLVSSLSRVVYVRVGGNDTSGDGQQNNPFATIFQALASIPAASVSNPIVIDIGPGTFTDQWSVVPNIVLRGSSDFSTHVAPPGGVMLNTTLFNITGPLSFGFTNIEFDVSVTIDFQTLLNRNSSSTTSFNDCKFNGLVVFRGQTALDTLQSTHNWYMSNRIVNVGTILSIDDFQIGDFTVNDAGLFANGFGSVIGRVSGGSSVGAITVTKSQDALFSMVFEIHGSVSISGLNVTGVVGGGYGNMTLSTDTVSLPKATSVTGYVTWTNK